LKRLVGRPSAEWFLLTGVSLSFGVAAMAFSLLAPGTSQVRASFGLMLLVPFCAMTVLGLDRLGANRSWLRAALLVALGWWGLGSVVSHWVPPGSPQALQLRASWLFRVGQHAQAAAQAEAGWQKDPAKSLLRSVLTDSWNQLGRTNEARQLVATALARWPADPLAHLDAAFDHAQSGRLDEALAETRRALALAPDHPQAARFLVMLRIRQRDPAGALAACREALRTSPHDPQLRSWLDELAVGRLPATP
jgi:tetratricopeptide (TPR) repeat protein